MIKFPVSVVISAVDKWTVPMIKMQADLNRTIDPVRGLTAKITALGDASGVTKIAQRFTAVSSSIGDAARQAMRFGAIITGLGAAAGGGLFALFRMTEATAAYGEQSILTARTIGISVQSLQELRYAAAQVDVQETDLATSLTMLSRKMGEAALGNRASARGFELLGIQVVDTEGKLRPVAEVLGETADRLNRLRDSGMRGAVTSMLFSRGWQKIAPVLQGGSAGLRAAAIEARSLNLVMSTESLRAAMAFDDANDRMRGALLGTRNAIGIQLMPVFTELLEKVTRFVTDHRSEIESYARRFAEGLPERLDKLWTGLQDTIDVIKRLGGWVKWLFDKFGEGPVIVTALAGIFTATLVPSILSVISSIALLNATIVTTPVGVILLFAATVVAAGAAIGVAIGLIIKNWDKIWPKVKSVWKSFVDFFPKSWELIKSNWNDMAVFWSELWDQIVGKFKAVWSWITDKLGSLSKLVPDWVKSGLGVSVTTKEAPRPTAMPQRIAAAAVAAAGAQSKATVKVEFANAPRGMRVAETTKQNADLDLKLGYAMLSGN